MENSVNGREKKHNAEKNIGYWQDPQRARKTFFIFLAAIAAVGLLFAVSSVIKPHRSGTVVFVGHVSQPSSHTGIGRHSVKHHTYSSDVKVRVKDSSETVTVYYRVGRASDIPEVGDEVEFAHSVLIGNVPYPQIWALKLGLYMLGLDLLVFA